ncbi:MAG: iron ABC transporter permease [Chloroflexi bacterium]|nr:iron ABC transporter permease [Chloroflexota bacterium]
MAIHPFRRLLPWLAPAAFLGLFFFYPLLRIIARGFDLAFFSTSEQFFLRTLAVLGFTFYQAALSTFLTLVLGLPLAQLFARFDFPFKAIFRALTAVPFMLPTVVVAAGFTALLGPRGWVNLGLMTLFHLEQPPVVFVGTLTAVLVAHVFYNATIVIRIVGNAWASLDVRLTDAARSLGASPFQTLMHVTLPLLRPSIFAASLLVFLFDFTSYGVILLLGGPKFSTLEVEIYIQALQMLNLPAASLLSLIQLLCTLVFSAIYGRYIAGVTSVVRPRAAWLNVQKPRARWQKFYVAGLLLFMILFFSLPLLALPFRSISRLEPERANLSRSAPGLTLDYYSELLINRRAALFYVPPFLAARNSLAYALLTVCLSLLLGFPAASALARPGKLEKWIDPLLMLPLGASSVTLGLGYILTFNRPLLPETWLLNTGHATLLTSPFLVPLVHTTIALPFVIRSLQAALAQIPNRYREVAAVLGASRWQIWKNVDWPIISRAAVTAGAFAFTVSLGEFGAASILARPEYPTLPTAIYRFLSQPGGMNYGQAMAMATILMLVCGLGILVIERLRLPGTSEF